MRRLTLAVAGAALLVLSLAPAAVAAGTSFAGVWVATDSYDGSRMLLTVSGGSAPAVTYQDFDAASCTNNGYPSHFVATGRGSVVSDPDTGEVYGLAVAFVHAGCGSDHWPIVEEPKLWLSFDHGVLHDQWGTEWQPLR